MLKAVLFDMDGLIVDTEPLQSKAFEIILRDLGKDPIFNDSRVIQTVGVREKDNWEIIKQTHGLDHDIETLAQKRASIYTDILKENVVAQPGLVKLLKLLKKHDVKMAVASSSSTEHIRIVLEGINIAQYFDAVVSARTLARGKPHPDVFLLAAEHLGVDPKDCVVLEDAENGVIAGKAAGARVVAVPNAFTKNHDHSLADLVVDSLEELDWATLQKVARQQ